MNKFIKLSILFLVTFSLLSCDKDIGIESSFPFASEAFGETKALNTNTITTTLRLTPERRIKSTEYYFSYDSDGKGSYTVRGVVLGENQEFKFNDVLTEELIYTPKVPGIHRVNFDFRDSNDNTSESSIEYEITEGNTVSFNVTAEKDEINISESLVLQASIEVTENEIVSQDLDFNLKFESTDDIATIQIKGIEYTSGDIIQNIDPSNFVIRYNPSLSGETNIIKLTLEASNGKSFVQELPITVTKTDFDFSFTPAVNESVLGMPVQISLDITQTSDEALTYSVEVSGQQGLLFDEFIGNQRFPVMLNNITSGDRSLRFTPQLVGTSEFIIKVIASNGDSKTKRLSFTTKPVDFDFEFSPPIIQLRSGGVRFKTVSFTLDRPRILGLDISYTMRVLSEVGSFTIRNINGVRAPGNVIPLPENTVIRSNVVSGQFEFPERINSSGTITVIVANSTGFEVRKTINVEVITN